MIEAIDVTKLYGAHLAVDRLSFRVDKGQVYGFLGPNGAGKSTTMNILTGCLAATSGKVLIDGHDIVEDPIAAKKHIGFLPEQPPLYLEMTPREYLDFVAEARGMKKKEERQKEIERVMGLCGVGEVADRVMRQLSKGFRQRCGLCMALIGDPDVILLDEPTVGLDPKQIIEIRQLIRSLGGDHTVILSSHILTEVSAICDEVLIMAHGKLVALGTPEELSRRMQSKARLNLSVRGDEETIRRALKGVPCELAVEAASEGVHDCELSYDPEIDIREDVFIALAAAKCPVLRMEQHAPTLEDVFLQLTGDDQTDTEEAQGHDGDL